MQHVESLWLPRQLSSSTAHRIVRTTGRHPRYPTTEITGEMDPRLADTSDDDLKLLGPTLGATLTTDARTSSRNNRRELPGTMSRVHGTITSSPGLFPPKSARDGRWRWYRSWLTCTGHKLQRQPRSGS